MQTTTVWTKGQRPSRKERTAAEAQAALRHYTNAIQRIRNSYRFQVTR